MKSTANPPASASTEQPDTASRSVNKHRPSPASAPPRPGLSYRPALSTKRNVPSFLSNSTTISPPAVIGTGHATTAESGPLENRPPESPTNLTRPAPSVPTTASLQQLREAVKHVQGKSVEKMKAQAVRSTPNSRRTAEPYQQGISPSLEAAFDSPLATGQQSVSTASTESTESVKTVRGTATSTPGQLPARTPSYPFPYVPSGVHSAFHQSVHNPFTTLSPTVSAPEVSTRSHHMDKYSFSNHSTPVAQPNFFAPGSPTPAGADSRLFPPGPNLYDVVLQLSADPTLGAWWNILTQVLHEHYKVERASLALPADTTDIENVPWGQKALYNADGLEVEGWLNRPHISSSTESEASRSSSSKKSDQMEYSSLLAARAAMRPAMESRHSFAGYEYGRSTATGERGTVLRPTSRPAVVRRTVTHVGSLRRTSADNKASPELPTPSIRESPYEEDTLSSGGGADDLHEDANATVLPLLRALDREENGLLDSSGVNRILQRGRLVTLTRDYSLEGESTRRNSGSTWDQTSSRRSSVSRIIAKDHGGHGVKAEVMPSWKSQPHARHPSFRRSVIGSSTGERFSKEEAEPYFEEYEQLPTSPWAQSPAPSPAIQQDAERNPFFVSGTLDEETFSPARSPTSEDYSRCHEVEAIGIDKAATIIHIPLIHPLFSRILTSEQDDIDASQLTSGREHRGRGAQSPEKRAPIAILSILSSDVPYPPSLIHSLKLLSPHLATSFQTSQQNTMLQERINAALYRQGHQMRGPAVSHMPVSGLGLSLGFETLLQFDPEDSRSSTADSLTSPSDYSGYSGRSRPSPTGSAVNTPGLDPGVHTRNPSATTPGQVYGSEYADNYFEVKKRTALSRSRSGGPVSQNQQTAQAGGRAPSTEPRWSLRNVDPSPSRHSSAPLTAKKDVKKARMKEEKSMAEQSPLRKRATTAAETEDSRRSVLHSYGADFSTSFQSLPAAAIPRPSGGAVHGRKNSLTEGFSMPPPSERLLRTIVDSLPVQIFTAAPMSGRVTWVNSKFLVYRGQTPRQVLDDPWEPIHPADLDDYMSGWYRSLHTGQQFQHKVRLRRFDDHYRWYYVRAAPLRDKAQNIVHWVGTMIDLHDQHVAEVNAARQQETAASEAKYRALANSSPQIVFAATKTRGITFCNSQWLAYSGQSEERAKATGFMEHVHPDDIIKCKLPMFEDVGLGSPTTSKSVHPQSQRTMSSMSSGSDASNESTVTATAATSTLANSRLPRGKLSDIASTGTSRVTKDATGKPSYSTEVRLRMKNGEYRWHLVRVLLAEPLVSVDAEEETWYGTCTDINDHKELEQTLKETMDAKSRFLSNMSHEIRTPLNGIAGMANFLIDSHLTPEQLDHVNVIRASTEGLRDLINDILDLSKVEAGMINLNMDWLHIRSLLEEVNDLTSSLALDKGLELNYLVDDTVPSMVKGDKFRFRQVLLNVIGNAIKFTQEGEVFTHCRLHTPNGPKDFGDSVLLLIDIIDTGRGFNEKEAERLFKRFSQIDGSSTRQHGGTGLGLVISMQLVELHGGTMSAKSVPGKGSTFTFSIRFGLPTDSDRPPDTGISSNPKILGSAESAKSLPKATPVTGPPQNRDPAPTMSGIDMSPTFYTGLEQRGYESPSLVSSAGSDRSLSLTARTSSRSSGSSQSSFTPEAGVPVQLGPIPDRQHAREAQAPMASPRPNPSMQARVYSIMVICPLQWTRTATVGHLNSVLDHTIPHMITARESLAEAQDLLGGHEPVTFSHIVLVLQDTQSTSSAIIYLLQRTPSATSIVVVADVSRKREITASNPQLDFESLATQRRLRFIHKPVKPSRLAVIFDPEKSRELSTDQNQQSAQQIALSQKRVFEEMTRRLGSKNFKVLLVEDNKINQMVMLKLLRRVSVDVDTCFDGVQATDKVLSKPPNYYSIILLDLMMPNKDGYQTCIDIRAWEAKRGATRPIPIVALSANVLDDVWHKCRAAGFNSYLTKPVEFKELSDVMTAFLDPDDPSKPMPSMKDDARRGSVPGVGTPGGRR